MSNVPKVRFKGFTDAWEQRKLSDICDFEKGRGLSREDLTVDGNHPCILYGQLFTDYGMFIDEVKSSTDASIEDVKLSEVGDILIPRCSTAPEGIGRASALLLADVILGFDINVLKIRDKSQYAPEFVSLAINHHQKDLQSKVVGTMVRHLENKEIKDVSVEIPCSKEEQKKIYYVFSNIDNLITLHQRKCDEAKELKSFMLQKMFPRNGELYPEVRFEGFTDAWEQRKLGDVADYRNGKAHENEIDSDGRYIVVNSKFVSTDGEVKKFSNAQNEPLFKNEIAFVLSDVPNGRAIARTFLIDKSDKYTLNQRIAGITPHDNTDPYYLHIKMNRNAYFLKFDDGNKQTNLSINDVMNYEDMYPSYDEQEKIGDYFRNLDNLITLHQRKCEELKEIKQYMLRNMFPQGTK